MNVAEGKGVKFLNYPVSNVKQLENNNNARAARVGQTRANKAAALAEARSGINHPRPMPVRNTKETGSLTARLRAMNTHREAFLNQQQFLSHAASGAAKPERNNCKQQGGTRKRVSKIKRKARHQPSRKNVKGHRSR
jgi:putative hemolysin